jgi:hypothetical protein
MDLSTDKTTRKKGPILVQHPTQVEPSQPTPETFSDVAFPQAPIDTEAELFVSNYKGLHLRLMTKSPIDPDQYTPVVVEFRDGMFRTDADEVIEALKSHMSFGGSAVRRFSDRPQNARESLFYCGSLPDHLLEKDRREAEQVTRDKTAYEDPYQKG